MITMINTSLRPLETNINEATNAGRANGNLLKDNLNACTVSCALLK